MNSFPDRIRMIRKIMGLSQDEFGKKIGMSRGIVQQWEQGRAVPYDKTLVKISEFSGKSLEWLTGEDLPAESAGIESQGVTQKFLLDMLAVQQQNNVQLQHNMSKQQDNMARQQDNLDRVTRLLEAQQASSDKVVEALTGALNRVGLDQQLHDRRLAKEVAKEVLESVQGRVDALERENAELKKEVVELRVELRGRGRPYSQSS